MRCTGGSGGGRVDAPAVYISSFSPSLLLMVRPGRCTCWDVGTHGNALTLVLQPPYRTATVLLLHTVPSVCRNTWPPGILATKYSHTTNDLGGPVSQVRYCLGLRAGAHLRHAQPTMQLDPHTRRRCELCKIINVNIIRRPASHTRYTRRRWSLLRSRPSNASRLWRRRAKTCTGMTACPLGNYYL